MATKNEFVVGLIAGMQVGGKAYAPKVWNDEGVYNYFYIDFLKPMDVFSIGMLTESILVYDSVQVPITGFEKVDSQKYKIYADISEKMKGVTVIGKERTLLSFTTGAKISAFSTMFYVAGIARQLELKYLFESAPYPEILTFISEEFNIDGFYPDISDPTNIFETGDGLSAISGVNELNVSVVLT